MANDAQLSDEQFFTYLHVLFLQTNERLIFDISATTVTEIQACTTTSSPSQRPERCLFSHQNLLFHDKRLLFGNKRLRTINRSLLIFVRSLLLIDRSLLLTARSLLFRVKKVQKVQPVFVCYIVDCVFNYMTDVQCDTNILPSCFR